MTQPVLLAKHLREVHFGGNWTWVNLKQTLEDVTWQEAVSKIHTCNTIAALTYHINYYVNAIMNVLKGTPLNAHDKYSFDVPPINSQEEWEAMKVKVLGEAEQLAQLVEQLPEEKLPEIFAEEKYGTYNRNLLGLIEHTHYHLGQVSILKKITREQIKT